MLIIRSIPKMRQYAARLKKQDRSIGLVPTMGCLHQGHLSLIRAARRANSAVILSIFVNPAQFGPKEDFKEYPRNFAGDCRLIRPLGVDAVFYPSPAAMYPENYQTYVEVVELPRYLCGASRPGHFRGVATVVAKLFNIIRPDAAYFGQKDAQQAALVKRMAADLNLGVKIRVMPIVRETDGLAMSSRNAYLSPSERKDALVLKNALQAARDMVKSGQKDAGKIKRRMRRIVKQARPSKIDYINIVNPETLQDVKSIKGRVLVALAVRIGKTRLIDNVMI